MTPLASSLLLVSTAWAVVSALAMSLLGLASLGGAKPAGGSDFGHFAVVWGIATVLTNLAAWGPTVGDALLIGYGAALTQSALAYLLLTFAATQVPAGAWVSRLRTLRAGAATLTVLVALLLVVAPRLLVEGTYHMASGYAPLWGPLYGSVVLASFFASLAATLVALDDALYDAPTPRTAAQRAILVAGVGLYAGYVAGKGLPFYLIVSRPGPATLLPLASTVAIALACARVAWRSLSPPQDAPGTRRVHRLLAASVLVPVAAGALEAAVTLAAGIPTLYTAGFWRLASVAILTLGIARWRLLDLSPWAQRASASGPGLATTLAVAVAAYSVGAFLAPQEGGVPLLAALALGGTTLVPSLRVSRRLLDLPSPGPTSEEAVFARRVEAYRSAVEASIARGDPPEDRAFLEALRLRFGLTAEAARVLRHVARAAVPVPGEDGEARFERLRLLGEGGAGRTWLARDRAREHLVVLKEPLHPWHRDARLRERVLAEARLAARVRHPHVVRVEQVLEGDAPLLVLEHLEGGSLADLLRERGTLPPREAVPIVVDALRGLHAVHQAGIVHRDVAPGNVLLDARGRAKVGDFGIAVRASGHRTVVDGAAAGTPAYRPPEALEGAVPDRRGDVYGAAAVLVACLAGTPPDPADPRRSLAAVPEALRPILARALDPDPAGRTPSAAALADELEATGVGR